MSCEKHCPECARDRQYEDYRRTVYGDCKSLADFNRAAWKALDVFGILIYGFLTVRLFWRALRWKA